MTLYFHQRRRSMANKRVYRVVFHNQGKIYELHARHVGQSDMYCFIEIGELIFGERSALLVDPAEEKLKAEFSGVKRTYIPMHAILRVDEVEKEGINKIISPAEGEKVTPFPVPTYPPEGSPGKN